jgi:hypothetical protein
MNLIKLTSFKDNCSISINVEHIGHLYEVPDKMQYGRINEPKHTVVGVLTHNNGGFRVKETIKQIEKLISNSRAL